MATNILMPALSPTMEEGKLAKWLVKEGDTVKSGTVLAEIETDKATMEFEAVDEGKIGKILVPEGSEGVKVNSPIAVLLGDGEDAIAALAGRRGGFGGFRLGRFRFRRRGLGRLLGRFRLLRRFGLHGGADVLHGGGNIDLAGLLAFAQKHGDGGIDLHAFAAFRHQYLADLAFVHGLEFHRGLVGLDLGQDRAGLDGVAFLHQPAGKLSLFHGGRQRRHQNVRRHGISPCSKRL